uniref:Uncharacterized protein n=1 Tax=Rhipicephalus pulchellus TaxID=72859 RepID=L7LZ90_RHIPC
MISWFWVAKSQQLLLLRCSIIFDLTQTPCVWLPIYMALQFYLFRYLEITLQHETNITSKFAGSPRASDPMFLYMVRSRRLQYTLG